MQDMKIAVWKTGHPIADTVADALHKGLGGELLKVPEIEGGDIHPWIQDYNPQIAYGILRGANHIFGYCDYYKRDWFNVDNGYFNPGHFNGYYRISYKGTQAKYDASFPCKEFEGEFEPIKRMGNQWAMICQPTDYVCQFFGVDKDQWLYNTISQLKKSRFHYFIRTKDSKEPLEEHFKECGLVVTFNSSVGWKAIQQGIPCLSDTTHSVVGSYYNTKSIDELIEKFNTMPRAPLFNFMQSHQFTLEEIEQGKAWPLINYYTSSSVTIQERQ